MMQTQDPANGDGRDAHPEEAEVRTDTVPAGHGEDGADAQEDVMTDPALDDRLGSDWVDEGGATPTGPATRAPAPNGQSAAEDPKRRPRIDREREKG